MITHWVGIGSWGAVTRGLDEATDLPENSLKQERAPHMPLGMCDANPSLETKNRKQLCWLRWGESTEKHLGGPPWPYIHEQLESFKTTTVGGGVCSLGVKKNTVLMLGTCPIYKQAPLTTRGSTRFFRHHRSWRLTEAFPCDWLIYYRTDRTPVAKQKQSFVSPSSHSS